MYGIVPEELVMVQMKEMRRRKESFGFENVTKNNGVVAQYLSQNKATRQLKPSEF